MSTKIIMRREGTHLVPATEFFAEDLVRIPVDRDVEVEITLARNLKQLKWCWALAGLITQNKEGVLDKEHAMDLLCTLAHHVDTFVCPLTEREYINRRSLKLSQDEMTRLQARFVYVTMMHLIPGMKESVLRDEIERMVTEDKRQAQPRMAPAKDVAA